MAVYYAKDILFKTVKISHSYSPTFALYGLLWWMGFFCRTRFSWKITSYALAKKTTWLDKYFERKYSSVLQNYLLAQPLKEDIDNKNFVHKIWVFWGQGENSMPELVKACYKQLKKYNDNVFLVTNENLKNLLDIDERIINKVHNGSIGYANFSDIIRNSLLAKYGGLWLDATVWVARKIPFDKLYEMPIYSANCKEIVDGKTVRFWSSYEWNWSSWCLWSRQSENPFFVFVSKMLQSIAINETIWPDYVIQDYLYFYACRKSYQIQEWMKLINIHNPNKDKLALLMANEFDAQEYSKLIENEVFFKLRYRKKWPVQTETGKETFCGRILRTTI